MTEEKQAAWEQGAVLLGGPEGSCQPCNREGGETPNTWHISVWETLQKQGQNRVFWPASLLLKGGALLTEGTRDLMGTWARSGMKIGQKGLQ